MAEHCKENADSPFYSIGYRGSRILLNWISLWFLWFDFVSLLATSFYRCFHPELSLCPFRYWMLILWLTWTTGQLYFELLPPIPPVIVFWLLVPINFPWLGDKSSWQISRWIFQKTILIESIAKNLYHLFTLIPVCSVCWWFVKIDPSEAEIAVQFTHGWISPVERWTLRTNAHTIPETHIVPWQPNNQCVALS